jgi:2-polyprenyl-3-methyl-5-hydroxy-6-metoxy-1,4-benzoquinol methylase
MDQVKSFYDKYNYPKINLFTNKQRKHNVKLVSKILSIAYSDINDFSEKKVLDAGCGTGEKSVLLSKYGAKVTAIDFSSGQLREAKQLAVKNKVDVIFKEKNILSDDLSDLGRFDLILSLGVLHHTENAELGFRRLSSLLKKDGIIIIGLYHRYARLRYRIARFLLRVFVSRSYNSEKIIRFLSNRKFRWLTKNMPVNSVYDRFVVPFESYHTLSEVKRWFKENKINLINHSSNVKGSGFFKIFEKKSLFFVSGKKTS